MNAWQKASIILSAIGLILSIAALISAARRRRATAQLRPWMPGEYEQKAKAGELGLGEFLARNGYPPTDVQ